MAALRELMSSYMKENNVKIKDSTDVNSIMRDIMKSEAPVKPLSTHPFSMSERDRSEKN